MKISVIGAKGGMGRKTVDRALESGHHVIAVVRNIKNISVTHEFLEVRSGDVTNLESLTSAISDAEAVVSAIGVDGLKKPTTIYSQGTANLLEAMKTNS